MAHILLIGDEALCAAFRKQLVRRGHTVAGPAAVAPTPLCVGVDECDVVVMAGDAAGRPGPEVVSDGGRGAVPAAPRLFLADHELDAPDNQALWLRIEECCRQARALRGADVDHDAPADNGAAEDVHQVGHELRSPLTVIKTALELMEGDLRSWNAAPADVDSQLRMLEIALRNVRRLHRAVEWSQMLLTGPRAEAEPLTAASSAAAMLPCPLEVDAPRQACLTSEG